MTLAMGPPGRLSIEEVLAKHSISITSDEPIADQHLNRLKTQHLKSKADTALKEGQLNQAIPFYAEAIQVCPTTDITTLRALHSNRSAALCKANRHSEALKEADLAIKVSPNWSKAHWRRGTALLSLKSIPQAVYAFLTAWQLSSSSGARAVAECEAQLKTVARRLTREQLGQEMYQYLLKMQDNNNNNNNKIEPPHREKITDSEASEAWFRLITTAQKRKPSTSSSSSSNNNSDDDSVVDHYELFLQWLKNGCDAVDAYYYRSEMHTMARCYLQGAEDAELAISAIKATLYANSNEKNNEGKDGSTTTTTPLTPSTTNQLKRQLAKLYAVLGTACLAEKDHPDCSPYKAARAFLLSLDAGTPSALISGKLEEAIGKITREQLEELHEDLYHNERLFDPAAFGMISTTTINGDSNNNKVYRVDVSVRFDCSSIGQCGARARELIRSSLASGGGGGGVKKKHIAFERVAVVANDSSSGGEDGKAVLLIQVSIQIGADKSVGDALVDSLNTTTTTNDDEDGGAINMLGGEELVELLGALLDCSAQLIDCTPKHTLPTTTTTSNTNNSDRQLMQPIRPKMELDLPYRHYRLVRADGSPAPRTDKHPFAMSRVYYDPSEKTTEEVWAEICDDDDFGNNDTNNNRCCRWTQTGGEIKIIAVNVPSDLPPRHLHVTFHPCSLQVANKLTGEIYLQGTLERGIVPEDCIWTHCGGGGEDGCLLTLKKMNLEVLQKPWAHSEMWWPRLFKHHRCEISWDDYEKDYSDLPEEVLERHRVGEAVKDEERRVEGVERGRRERLERGDEERKRRRQERLGVLRDGGKR